jgi:hypothetical protein
METATVTIAELIRKNRITLTAERWHENPNMDSQDMDHWKTVLRMGNRRMTVYFSQGYYYNGKAPKADAVLDCLASDSSAIENNVRFEDWCSEFGYDSDSRKAEKIFKTCEHQAKRLRSFLGEDLFNTLLWDAERL